jgi:hypothetical protein
MTMRMTVLASVLMISNAAQQPQKDSLLDHLIGKWVLRGPMAGKAVVHDVTVHWVLGGEYVEMHEFSRERTPTGKPAYEAIVHFVHDPHNHEYGALWLDNTDYNAPAACRIRFAIFSGCEISETWLASTSMVVAPIRFAIKRSRSGLMVRSSVDTAYQLGFCRHAACVVVPVSRAL